MTIKPLLRLGCNMGGYNSERKPSPKPFIFGCVRRDSQNNETLQWRQRVAPTPLPQMTAPKCARGNGGKGNVRGARILEQRTVDRISRNGGTIRTKHFSKWHKSCA